MDFTINGRSSVDRRKNSLPGHSIEISFFRRTFFVGLAEEYQRTFDSIVSSVFYAINVTHFLFVICAVRDLGLCTSETHKCSDL